MGKIDTSLGNDLLQTLNVVLQQNASALQKCFPNGEHSGFFISEEKPGLFHLRSLEGPIATFSLEQLPGCCGAVVSYHSEVASSVRNKGLGTVLLNIRMCAARGKKWGLMLATVLASNAAELKILQSCGWVISGEFRSPKTGNVIKLLHVNL